MIDLTPACPAQLLRPEKKQKFCLMSDDMFACLFSFEPVWLFHYDHTHHSRHCALFANLEHVSLFVFQMAFSHGRATGAKGNYDNLPPSHVMHRVPQLCHHNINSGYTGDNLTQH